MRTTHNLQRSLRYLLAWAPTLALSRVVAAQHPLPDAVLQSGALSFVGHATVGDFVGTTTRVAGAMLGGLEYSATHGWVEAQVATLVTGNERRDRELRATMSVDRFPIMRFDLARTTVVMSPLGDPDSIAVMLHGVLTIRGVARTIDLPARVLRKADTTSVTARFPLDLSDYGIHGLTKMFGLLRMEREIEVRVDLHFVDHPAEPSP
jgi:polyisoprenoid-binding protein YceI